MRIKIANVLGIQDAEIEVNNTALTAGPNASGKTSIKYSAGLALTGEALPQYLPKEWTNKRISKAIIRHGSKDAMVHIENGASTVSVSYPQCAVSSTGEDPPHASRIAVGFDRVMDMKPIDRQQFFSTLLKSDPGREVLIAELKPAEMSKQQLDDLWDKIKMLGWDALYNAVKEQGAKMKGAWEQCAGQKKYGRLIAESWTPEGWKPELINGNAKELENHVAAKRRFIEVALKETAVSESEIGRLQELVERLPELEKDNTEKHRKMIELDAKWNVLKGKEPDLIYLEADQACPYCKKPLDVVHGIVKAVVKLSDAKLKKNAAELKKLRKQMEDLNVELRKAADVSLVAKGDLGIANEAAKTLRSINAPAEKVNMNCDIETARTRLGDAERDLYNFNVKQTADGLHHQILRQTILVQALAPDGIRLKVLNEALAKVNLEIRELTAPTDFELFKFDEDMNVMYGDIPYIFCSLSEKLWINTVLQVLVARRDGSDLIIVDEFDTFMKQQRSWMMKFFMAAKVPVLVLMSMSKMYRCPGCGEKFQNEHKECPKCSHMGFKLDLPDFSKIGGNVYWIEKGMIKS